MVIKFAVDGRMALEESVVVYVKAFKVALWTK